MDHSKRLDSYCELMEEIKARLDVVSSIVLGMCGPLPKRVAEELCYLQLRMTCELIALACLVAHGDVTGTRTSAMRKRYEADWIMNMLEKLHPEFYPEPSRQHIGGDFTRLEPITSGYLTQKELVALYHECGKVLHRGTIEDVLSRHARSIDFSRVKEWTNKIVVLLNHHQIRLVDRQHQYIVVMHGKEDGLVHATQFVRIGEHR